MSSLLDSKGRKGSTLMKAETSVIEIDEDTLDVSTEEAEVIVTVKKAKQNTSNRQGYVKRYYLMKR